MKILVGIFVTGSMALFLANRAFTPVSEDAVLLSMIPLWFIGAGVLQWATKRDDGNDTDSYYPQKRYFALVCLPWLFSAVLCSNAMADSSPPAVHKTIVRSGSKGRYGSDLKVESWRPSHGAETMLVDGSCCNGI